MLQVQGVTLRDLFEHHSDLLNQAMKYYTDRVTYWMKTYNDLKTGNKFKFKNKNVLKESSLSTRVRGHDGFFL